MIPSIGSARISCDLGSPILCRTDPLFKPAFGVDSRSRFAFKSKSSQVSSSAHSIGFRYLRGEISTFPDTLTTQGLSLWPLCDDPRGRRRNALLDVREQVQERLAHIHFAIPSALHPARRRRAASAGSSAAIDV